MEVAGGVRKQQADVGRAASDRQGADGEGDRPADGSVETDGAARDVAFDLFFAQACPRLISVAYVLTGDRAAAQDLAQEALVRAWERWPRLSTYDDPEAWARRVVHNLAVSRWRVRRRLVFGGRTPARTVDGPRAAEHQELVAALRHLPDQQRRAVVLHDALAFPIASVAAELGVPEGTVKSWLHRGRNTIARRLAHAEERERREEAERG